MAEQNQMLELEALLLRECEWRRSSGMAYDGARNSLGHGCDGADGRGAARRKGRGRVYKIPVEKQERPFVLQTRQPEHIGILH